MSDSTPPQQFDRAHTAYRFYRSRGLSQTESMRTVRQFHFDLWKKYCDAQENGEAWTREPLDMTEGKRLRNLSIIQTGGKLP